MSSSGVPELPELAALANDDSMLTRRFGKEVINYYAGGRLNRFSFLRPDTNFLRKTASAKETRYIALLDLNPVVQNKCQLAHLSFDDVKPLIGSEPFKLAEDEAQKQFDSTKSSPLIVFLGMLADEGKSRDFESTEHGTIVGQPYFAVNIPADQAKDEPVSTFLESCKAQGFSVEENPRAMTLQADEAAMFAQARSMIDWNVRNPFCGGCGNRTMSVNAGYKRVCPPTDFLGNSTQTTRPDCPTRHGISNLCFPRTDPTMIAAVVSADGQRVLLGRQKRWPPNWYSTLAGFLEPAEGIEEAVRREVWEESGVKVGRVVIHSSQPWPYPANLMIGAIAQALPGEAEQITLNDKELENAKWFSMDEVREALEKGTSNLGENAPEGYREGALRLPPRTAIANRLITAVADGYLFGIPKM